MFCLFFSTGLFRNTFFQLLNKTNKKEQSKNFSFNLSFAALTSYLCHICSLNGVEAIENGLFDFGYAMLLLSKSNMLIFNYGFNFLDVFCVYLTLVV